ncbi:unnamed protein product, partial [Urochloa humidicola]
HNRTAPLLSTPVCCLRHHPRALTPAAAAGTGDGEDAHRDVSLLPVQKLKELHRRVEAKEWEVASRVEKAMAGRAVVVVRTDAARAMSREAVATTDELRGRLCEWSSLPGAMLSSPAGHSHPQQPPLPYILPRVQI